MQTALSLQVTRDRTVIPAYLKQPAPAEETFGVLRLDKKSGNWVIEAEPFVLDLAKRLFPGCETRQQGVIKFRANNRFTGELNWLMQRYPLRIDSLEYHTMLSDVQERYLKRQEMQQQSVRTAPPPTFTTELMPFQQEGLTFLLQNHTGTLLADDMGLGKTPQALAFLAAREAWPALIVVPSHLIINWQREIKKFLRLPTDENLFMDEREPVTHVLKGLSPYTPPKADIYLIHYLLLRGWKNELPEMSFKAVIFDEIQELRRKFSDKYSAASLLSGSCPNVIGLSGTPIYNKGGEIWNIINILEFQALGDWESFTREWCEGYGSEYVKDPEKLGTYLKREGLMLRRHKDEVLEELPPKRRVVQTIDYDSGVFGDLIREAVHKAIGLDAITDQLERGRETREIVGAARQATGIAKAPYVSLFVRTLLEGGARVLLFAHHHAVFDIYMDELAAFNPVRITGVENKIQKTASEDAFMSGKTDVCIVSLRAAAGLNLQRANVVVFGELDWSPAVHSQAEDRAHRMGQNDSVLAYYLVAENGIDEQIQDVLGLKISQFVGIMGDKEETEEDKVLAQVAAKEHMKRIVEHLKNQR